MIGPGVRRQLKASVPTRGFNCKYKKEAHAVEVYHFLPDDEMQGKTNSGFIKHTDCSGAYAIEFSLKLIFAKS